MSDEVREITQRVTKRVGALGDEFEEAGWRNHFLDLSTYLMNRRGAYLLGRDYEPMRGGKMNKEIANGTPEEAVWTSAAGMMGGFTNPSTPWFVLQTEDIDLMKSKSAMAWLWRQQEKMYSVYSRSNWYQQLPQMYAELTVFGSAAMRMDAHLERGIHCTQHTIGSFYFSNGTDGFVDSVVYRYPRTVRQLEKLYGIEQLTQGTRDRFNAGDLDAYIRCVNVIEPNDGQDRKFVDWKGMRYRSITMEEDHGDHEMPLHMGGFEVFPTITPRTTRLANDPYGSSRGMRALPDARQLQLNELRGGEGLLKTLRPTLNVPSAKMRATVVAGQTNVYRGSRSDAIRPTFTTTFPYGENEDKIVKLENRLWRTLGADVHTTMQTLDATGNHNMTIPEIQARIAEKMSLLGPTHHSVHTEMLSPANDILYYNMGQQGMIDPPPPELEDVPLKVEFTSQLALSQRAQVTNGIMQLFGRAGDMAALGFPSVLDNLDEDEAIRTMAFGFLAPPNVVRDPEAVADFRRAQAEQARQQQQLEQQAMQAKSARDLAAAPVGDQNALEAVAA